MRKLALEQRSPEWLKMRQSKIGSSDAPAIVGVSPYKTQYQLWEEKTLGKTQYKTPAMQRGIDLESIALKQYEVMTGYLMAPCVVLHEREDWKVASLDGVDINEEHAVEIKCANAEHHKMAMDGKVPDCYIPQLQHQMDVCDLDQMHYFSFDGSKGVIVVLKRDDNYIRWLSEKEQEFYDKVIELTPPKMCDKDYNERIDREWRDIAMQWQLQNKALDELESQIKTTRDRLVEMAGDQNSCGAGIKVLRYIRKGNINYNSIPELNGMDLEPYRKEPIESWRISKQ